jgi:drug/metabolite transporter (DMT)-like permease
LRTLHPADLLAVELVGSALMLVAVGLGTGRMHRRGSLRALAQGAVSPGLTFLLCNLGLARTTATGGSLLLGAETLMTVLLAIAVLGERIGRAGAAALTLGMAGTVLVAVDGGRPVATFTDGSCGQTLGNLLVLSAVACGAVYVVWSRRSALEPAAGIGLTAWQSLGATLNVTPFVVVSWLTDGSRLPEATAKEWAVALAVLACGLGARVAFNLGIGGITAARAGMLLSLQPVRRNADRGHGSRRDGGGRAVGRGALIVAGVIVISRDRPVTAGRECAGALSGRWPTAGRLCRLIAGGPGTTPTICSPTTSTGRWR